MAPHASLRGALSAVTASLIGTSVAHAAGPNSTETSILFYSEKDRTRATEATFNWSKELKSRFNLSLRLTYDALTGATPTGESPSKYAQTITRPSGGQVVLVPAGVHPVDDSFKDTRFSAEFGMSRYITRTALARAGVRWSGEHDYKSVGINGGITQDIFRRNTTIGVSAAYARDVISPVGGFYVPYSEVGSLNNETPDERRARFEGKAKRVFDYIITLAQVIDRRTVIRFNWSGTRASGYMTDPYKILSVVQPADSLDPGEPVTQVYENRPSDRNQNAVMAQLRRQLWSTAADVSYRYFWDTWGVRSHAVDLTLHLDFNRVGAFLPRVRWYHQSAASFHVPFLVQGETLPEYASADSRLADFDAWTMGLGYSYPLNPTSRLNFSLEYYMQRGDVDPTSGVGTTLPFELFPKLDVIMVRLGYAHEFF